MDNAGYATLTRQSALMSELRLVANNVANASTTGFRREGIVFSEFVVDLGKEAPSMSMARAAVRATSAIQGELKPTGGALDFAIEGPGFFQVETPDGVALTRNGAFTSSATNELVTLDGLRVLDVDGAPIFIPSDGQIAVSSDGTLSVDGQPLAQLGLFRPLRPEDVSRGTGTLFHVKNGATPAPGRDPGDPAPLPGKLERGSDRRNGPPDRGAARL